MQETLEQLIGLQEEKPFECVGSRDEINTAIVMTIDKLTGAGEELPALLSYYKEAGRYDACKPAGDRFSAYFDENNLVPAEWEMLVREKCAVSGGRIWHT